MIYTITGYYDYILGFIPLVLLGITGTPTVARLQLTTVVPIAADVAALLTDHALFVNRPSSPSPSHLDEHAGPDAADAPSPSILDAD